MNVRLKLDDALVAIAFLLLFTAAVLALIKTGALPLNGTRHVIWGAGITCFIASYLIRLGRRLERRSDDPHGAESGEST